MFKNTASQKITFLVIDTATNLPKTGDAANLTAYVSIDDGTVTVLGDTSASELDATNAPGLYAFDCTQAETNGDKLVFSGKSSTSGVRVVPVLVYTLPASFTALNVTNVNTLASHDPGATLGTSTLTQAQVTGGAYAINSVSFAFNAALDFTTTQKAGTIARVTLTDTVTTYTGNTPQTGDAYARLGAPSGASLSADVAAVKTDTGNLVTRITSTLFSGITSLSQWLGMLAGKQVGNTTARTEIRATGAGSGTYDETTDSQEAIRDRGDAAYLTATSVTVSDKTGFKLASDGLAAVTTWTVSITGNLTGNVTGSVGSVASGGITAASIAADAIGASELASDAVAEIAAAVWDLTTTGHTTGGTFGAAMNAAGSAGDPWSTALPGAYSAGSAGYIVGTNLNATVSSRSTYAGGDTSGTTTLLSRLTSTRATNLDNLDASVAAVKSDTAAILDDTGTSGVVVADKTGYSLASTGLNSVLIDGKTLPAAVQIVSAIVAGKITGAGTGTETFKGLDGATTRAVVTVDSSGNRSGVSYP